MSPDFITLIRCRGSLVLAKRYLADGTVVDYDRVKTIDLHCLDGILGLQDIYDRLFYLLDRPDCAAIWGRIVDPARTIGVQRLYAEERTDGLDRTIGAAAHRWAALDMDDIPRPADVPAADLVACGAIARAALPLAFHGARCIVQASAGHGVKPGCRLRLWFWLSRPATGAEMMRWLKDAPTDTSVFRNGQPIYTAAPMFEGRADHLQRRLAWLDGGDQVQVPAPAELAPPVPVAAVEAQSKCDPNDSLIARIRQHYDLHAILVRHGYKQSPSDPHDYRHPASKSGNYAARLDSYGGVHRLKSLNGGDPLAKENLGSWHRAKSVDAFDALVVLEFGGDWKRALITLGKQHGYIEDKPPPPKDERRKEISRRALRLYRANVCAEDILSVIAEQNSAFVEPLPDQVIHDTLRWASRIVREEANA